MKYKSVTEINNLTVNDLIIELMSRLLDLSVLPLGSHFYNLLPDEGQTLYERIQVHVLLVKPTMEELEAGLIDYKVEILADFDVNAAENERVAALKARFLALPDMRRAISILGITDAQNMKAYARDIIISKDNTLLDNLEGVNTQVQAILDEQTQDTSDTKDIKKLIRDFDVNSVNSGNAVAVLKNVIRALQKTIAR